MTPLVIAGHGIELTLQPAVHVAQLGNGTLIFGPTPEQARGGAPIRNVAVKVGAAPDGPLEARPDGATIRYTCGADGATEISLGHGVSSYREWFAVRVTPRPSASWTVIARDHEIYWPPGFTLGCNEVMRQRSAYELRCGGVADQMVTVHGPYVSAEIPPPPALVSPGMTMVGSGDFPESDILWFELWYEHAQEPWKQMVYYVPCGKDTTHLVRADAPSATAEDVFAAADVMAQTLRAI